MIFIRWSILILGFAVASVSLKTGASESPMEDFQSDSLLHKGLSDVAAMNREELERFIDYLAACDTTQAKEAYDLNCQKARSGYALRYERGRAIDRFVFLLPFTKTLIEAKDGTSKQRTSEKEEVNNLLLRYVYVEHQIKEAVRRAYTGLNRATPERRN